MNIYRKVFLLDITNVLQIKRSSSCYLSLIFLSTTVHLQFGVVIQCRVINMYNHPRRYVCQVDSVRRIRQVSQLRRLLVKRESRQFPLSRTSIRTGLR